ncbi:manganese efflux pump [Alicyclobacillus ferrooxydans]|uniref:manganese efflux pump n=1 Tax=Alicyclobacillus ferrooxydans TaxID=471514 RepID=UPI003CCBD436
MTALRVSSMIPGQMRYVVGAAILVCVGSWSMVQTWLPSASCASTGSPLRQVVFSSGGFRFGLNEMMFVGLANGLTALTVGFGVGFANLSLTTSALSVGLCNFSVLTIPVWLGMSPRPRKWGKHVILVCSVLLIVSALQL